MRDVKAGDVIEWQRRFTVEEVRAFADFSLDHGTRHRTPDAQGRLLVHGLLTATLPTKIGGDLDFLAQKLTFEFLRPVYTGELVTCALHVLEVLPETGRVRLRCDVRCTNEAGKEVMRGTGDGVILQR